MGLLEGVPMCKWPLVVGLSPRAFFSSGGWLELSANNVSWRRSGEFNLSRLLPCRPDGEFIMLKTLQKAYVSDRIDGIFKIKGMISQANVMLGMEIEQVWDCV
jgi:hypothetical protein